MHFNHKVINTFSIFFYGIILVKSFIFFHRPGKNMTYKFATLVILDLQQKNGQKVKSLGCQFSV